MLRQRDRIGWLVCDEKARVARQPHSAAALDEICRDLETHEPDYGTDWSAWDYLAQPNYRRGMVIILSDCLVDLEHITKAIDRLRHRGHDCVLVSLLTSEESTLEINGPLRCLGLEGEGELTVEPRSLRNEYQQIVKEHLQGLEAMCRSRGVIFQHATTLDHPGGVLRRLLVSLAE